MNDYKFLIDGKLVSGAMALDVINPATEEVVAVRQGRPRATRTGRRRGQSGLSAVVGDARARPRRAAGEAR